MATVCAALFVVVACGDGDDSGPEGPADGSLSVAGTRWEGDNSTILSFGVDGRFAVVRPDGVTIDAGVYSQQAEQFMFNTEAGYDCAGVAGEYAVSFSEPGRIQLNVVWDECTNRVGSANGAGYTQVD